MTAEEGHTAPALEATTVIAAYGNEGGERRSAAPWLDAHLDDLHASPPIEDDWITTSDPRQEPRLGDLSVAQVEARDIDAPAVRPARYVAALVGVLAIAALAALGSYTFVQRGVAQIERAEPDAQAGAPTSSPSGLRNDSFDTAPSAKPEGVVPPASATSPAADAPPASEAPAASDAPAAAADPASASNEPTASDGAPAVSPPARAVPAKRKPAATPAAPPASQDAIETEKIITRELRSASPPQPR